MRILLKIVAVLLLILLAAGIALNFYFTDERLRTTLLPYINDSIGREVQAESISATFFSTFPRPGIEMNSVLVPGETASDTVLAAENITASIEILPLFNDEISITELNARSPRLNYTIFADSTSNLDFFFEQESDSVQDTETYSINIPYFELDDGSINYRDQTSGTSSMSA